MVFQLYHFPSGSLPRGAVGLDLPSDHCLGCGPSHGLGLELHEGSGQAASGRQGHLNDRFKVVLNIIFHIFIYLD